MRMFLRYLVLASLLLAVYQSSFLKAQTSCDKNSIVIYPKQTKEIDHLQQDYFSFSPKNYEEQSEEFGNQEIFWIYDYDDLRYEERRATLLSIGEKCYVYLANETINQIGQAAGIAKCNGYRDEFDAVTYDKNVELAGHPDGRLGDIDGDPKVTILLVPLGISGGCYWTKDDDPTHPNSNHREMFYLSSEMEDDQWGYVVMMHEFNHLIWFNYEQDEGHFLTEGAAVYAMYYAGYLTNSSYLNGENLSPGTRYFALDYQTSLLSWHIERSLFLASDYGKAYMFMFYMAEKYGNELIKTLVTTYQDGPQGIDVALAETGYNTTFNEVFLNWITACTIDEEDFENGRYGFKKADFTIVPKTNVLTYPYEKINKEHYYYGFDVKRLFNTPDKFTFTITKPDSRALGIVIALRDQNGWKVTQTVHSEESEMITEYVSGEGIEEAYIITAVMSEDTPFSFVDMYGRTNEPYYLLNYTIEEGHISTGKAPASIIGLTFGVLVLSFGTRIVIIKSRQKKHIYN